MYLAVIVIVVVVRTYVEIIAIVVLIIVIVKVLKYCCVIFCVQVKCKIFYTLSNVLNINIKTITITKRDCKYA